MFLDLQPVHARRMVIACWIVAESWDCDNSAFDRRLDDLDLDLDPPLVWHVYGDRYRIGA